MAKSKLQRNAEYRAGHREELRAKSTAYYWQHLEIEREKRRKYYRDHREDVLAKTKIRQLKRFYGMTKEDHDLLWKKQNGLCALCNKPLPGQWGRHTVVDHNHKTGYIRGLLHRKCNLLIGYADEDPEMLKLGLNYLVVTTICQPGWVSPAGIP